MNEEQALRRMISPGMTRPGKPRGGVIQIWVTRACDKACFGCTQGSNLGGKLSFISLDHFRLACESLRDYFGIVGVFGGNPALHPEFPKLCEILAEIIPPERRGLWCNHPKGHGAIMRKTFNPAVSNLNVHLDKEAYDEFRRDWPESRPFGLDRDSRHSPVYVALKDVLKKPCGYCNGKGGHWNGVGAWRKDWDCDQCSGTGEIYDIEKAWDLISKCDINQHWSAMIGVFRGELRAWFCEIAGAQAMLHQYDPDYPDTGIPILSEGLTTFDDGTADGARHYWWKVPMVFFAKQVRQHCHSCGVPLKGHGELAQASDSEGKEYVSATHEGVYKTKRKREVELVTLRNQLGEPLDRMTHYLQNGGKK